MGGARGEAAFSTTVRAQRMLVARVGLRPGTTLLCAPAPLREPGLLLVSCWRPPPPPTS